MERIKIDEEAAKKADAFAEREYVSDGYEREWLSKGYYHGYKDAKDKLFEWAQKKFEEYATMVGMFLLFGLVFVVMFKDVFTLFR